MKAFITTIIATATITWPGAMSVRSQEPPTSSTPAPLAAFERDEQLDRALAEVQQQVEFELDTAVALAGAKTRDAQRQMAKVQQALELAQAAAPVAPVTPPALRSAAVAPHAPAF